MYKTKPTYIKTHVGFGFSFYFFVFGNVFARIENYAVFRTGIVNRF